MTRRRDSSYYDLLASEARLSTFVPSRKDNCRRRAGLLWTKAHQRQRQTDPALVERIDVRVPDAFLVMPTYEGTLLDQTCRTAWSGNASMEPSAGCPGHVGIRLQHRGRSSQLPVRAFGVPGLGLKRGWPRSGVAPYASRWP